VHAVPQKIGGDILGKLHFLSFHHHKGRLFINKQVLSLISLWVCPRQSDGYFCSLVNCSQTQLRDIPSISIISTYFTLVKIDKYILFKQKVNFLISIYRYCIIKNSKATWTRWLTPVIPAIRRLRQKNPELEASLGYIGKPVSKKNQKQRLGGVS
jgi:hypothetical protein